MAVMPDIRHWTAAMVQALPDDGARRETIHGELLVSPSPRLWHQTVLMRLTDLINRYLRREPIGAAYNVDADISWAPDVLVQPDLLVIPFDEAGTRDWAQVRTLLLVAEVLSPRSRRADRVLKRQLYQGMRIPLYWIVDADNEQVECWTPTSRVPVIARERIVWHPVGAGTACVIELAELFGEIGPPPILR